jgi:hypothetical protein
MLLHEANQLMLLQKTFESFDIPTEYEHYIEGGGEGTLPLPVVRDVLLF